MTAEFSDRVPMTDDNAQRLKRLAERAKTLDDAIRRAAQMNKQIVEEIRRLGERDKLKAQRPTSTPKPRRKGKQGNDGERTGRGR